MSLFASGRCQPPVSGFYGNDWVRQFFLVHEGVELFAIRCAERDFLSERLRVVQRPDRAALTRVQAQYRIACFDGDLYAFAELKHQFVLSARAFLLAGKGSRVAVVCNRGPVRRSRKSHREAILAG